MLKIEEAIRFAADHFPNGPEALAAHLGLQVHVCDLGKKEGWCIRVGEKVVIRVNSGLSEKRQRFTLAHELGHYLLRTTHVMHQSLTDIFRGKNKSEEMANRVAAELLLPDEVVAENIRSIPLDGHAITRLAKTANVSEIATAIRIASAPERVGLIAAAVLGFEDRKPIWCPVKAFVGVKSLGTTALETLLSSKAPVYRCKDRDLDVVAFLLKEGKRTLFLQRMSSEAAEQKTYAELKRESETFLYEHHPKLRSSVEGCLSMFRQQAGQGSRKLEEAISLFEHTYGDRWNDEFGKRLFSLQGKTYLRMRLSAWYNP